VIREQIFLPNYSVFQIISPSRIPRTVLTLLTTLYEYTGCSDSEDVRKCISISKILSSVVPTSLMFLNFDDAEMSDQNRHSFPPTAGSITRFSTCIRDVGILTGC